jgi:hypothetical protein
MQSTRILSWDVGIKHLAYNLSEYVEDMETHKINLTIIQWGIINLSLEKCSFCDKDGFYVYEEKYYCMNHCKKLRVKHFCNVEKCYDKAKYNIDVKSNDANNELINKYMCEKHGPKLYSNDLETQSLKVKLIEKLDLMKFEPFTYLLIENQPTFKNPKMKAIADTLYAWFLIRKIIDEKILLVNNIRLISPGRKNKLFFQEIEENIIESKEDIKSEDIKSENITKKESKLTYKDGKKKSIDLTLSLITEEWKIFINEYSKKDDLADCLLQGYSFYTDLIEEKQKEIRKINKKQKAKDKALEKINDQENKKEKKKREKKEKTHDKENKN